MGVFLSSKCCLNAYSSYKETFVKLINAIIDIKKNRFDNVRSILIAENENDKIKKTEGHEIIKSVENSYDKTKEKYIKMLSSFIEIKG
jgi:hypothetical protein